MTPQILFYIIIGIIIIDFIIDKYIDYLNAKHFNDKIPDELKDVYNEEEYYKSQSYKKENYQFSLITSGFSIIVTLAFFVFKGFAWVDELVGRLIKKLRDEKKYDNTLVILTADHGEGLGQHGEGTHGLLIYDSTMRIPLLFWGADFVPRGRRAQSLVRLVDVTPTVLDLVNAPLPPGIQGVIN